MKKLILLSALVTALTSCQVTERFNLDDDGTVLQEMEVNMSAILEMAGDEAAKKTSIDTIVDATDDGLESILPSEEQTEEQNNQFNQLRKHMDKSKIHIVQNDNELIINILTETENLEELNAYNQKLNEKQQEIEAESQDGGNSNALHFATFSYDDHKFERKIYGGPLIDNVSSTSQEVPQENVAELFIYTLEYNLPKPIKDSSLEKAVIDGNTMTFTDKLSNILENEDQFKNLTLDF